jgi:3-methyladenine DNA glycosylase AlkD
MTAVEALRWLERHGARRRVEGMARYGIPSDGAVGVPVGQIKAFAKKIGRDHELALGLWDCGCYEARLLAAFVGDPKQITARQMDEWAAGFDNWAVVDTVCFALFDRSPHAWKKARQWTTARAEFKRRAGFALIWSLTVHDKAASDKAFLDCLPLIENGALDERHFVKKAVSMALRAVGKRNPALKRAAIETAKRLADSELSGPRSIGKEALRELR